MNKYIEFKENIKTQINDFLICQTYFPLILTYPVDVIKDVFNLALDVLRNNNYIEEFGEYENQYDQSLNDFCSKRIIGFAISRNQISLESIYEYANTNRENNKITTIIETKDNCDDNSQVIHDIFNIIEENIVLMTNGYRFDLSGFDEVGISLERIGFIKGRELN